MTSQTIQKLAYKMALNHINLSLPDPASNHTYGKILKRNGSIFQEKIVLVIGAGASYSAAKLPVAVAAREHNSQEPRTSAVSGPH